MYMMIIRNINSRLTPLEQLKDFPLLFIRLVLAYGFFLPARMKWGSIDDIAGWFESMNYPLPLVSAYVAAIFESLGVILLLLGFGTRYISIPLIIIMLVAIFTVHLENGFNASDNGYEIPLYYSIMLLTIFVYGAGTFSIDKLFSGQK